MQKNKLTNVCLSLCVLLFILCNRATAQVKFVRHINAELSKSEKEALIILPGFGDSKKSRKKQIDFFKEKGYDVYIPSYKNKKTVEECVQKFAAFYTREEMTQYKKVHVFSYIIGSWTINKFINEYGKGNISTIVYNRSPIQERAPYIAFTYLKRMSRIKFGPILEDFLNTKYSPIVNDSINLGIIIEAKATKIMRLYKKKTIKMGPLNWQVDSLYQKTDDYFFTWLNHEQMYSRFDIVGDEVLNFIRLGKFSSIAKKENYDWDPFVSYKKEGLK